MDKGQGIVHVMGPEQGATLPGMTVAVATRTPLPTAHSAHWLTVSALPKSSTPWRPNVLPRKKSKSMLIAVEGRLKPGVTAKDVALYIIGQTVRPAVQATPSNLAVKPSAAFLWKAA